MEAVVVALRKHNCETYIKQIQKNLSGSILLFCLSVPGSSPLVAKIIPGRLTDTAQVKVIFCPTLLETVYLVLIYSLSCHIVKLCIWSHCEAVYFAILLVPVSSREGVRPIPGLLRRFGRLLGVVPQHKQGTAPQLKKVLYHNTNKVMCYNTNKVLCYNANKVLCYNTNKVLCNITNNFVFHNTNKVLYHTKIMVLCRNTVQIYKEGIVPKQQKYPVSQHNTKRDFLTTQTR